MSVRREIERPRQAVILAGGLGTRLRPLTNSLPKPMIPVNGRPFMTYLVDQLRENGFERILMLPMNMSVTDEEIDYVCQAIKSFYR